MLAQRIAQLYADPGPFASVFADVSRDSATGDHEVELRARTVAERLDEQGAPRDVVDTVKQRLTQVPDDTSPTSRMVVISKAGVVMDEISTSRLAHDTVTWSSLPDLGRWIAHEDQTLPFVLALVDHEGGDVAAYRGDVEEPDTLTVAGGADPNEHKIRGGGMAHKRYQRTAENAWADNAAAVAREIQSLISSGERIVLLAGDPTTRSAVRSEIGTTNAAEIIDIEHGGRARDGGDDALFAEVEETLATQVASRNLQLAHELKERLGRGEGAVTGVQDAATVLIRGQAETLILDLDEAELLNVVPRDHPGLALSGMPTNEPVRADLALIAAAARTDADVVISSRRASYGASVAALLRWDDNPG